MCDFIIYIVRTEENGVDPGPVERGADRGRRGRGRGEPVHTV